MPLNTNARLAAERLFILTESLSDAIVNDRVDEIAELIAARQSTLDQLSTLTLDAPAIAILDRIAASERDLLSLIQRTRSVAVQDLAQLYAGMKQVRAYKKPRPMPGLLKTG